MKLTPVRVDQILELIARMRGSVTQPRIHIKVEAKIVTISRKQLFSNPDIHAAWEDKVEAVRLKKKSVEAKRANTTPPKLPKNAALIIDEQQRNIKRLEENLDIILSNAIAQGVDPRLINQPLNVVRHWNTYKNGHK